MYGFPVIESRSNFVGTYIRPFPEGNLLISRNMILRETRKYC